MDRPTTYPRFQPVAWKGPQAPDPVFSYPPRCPHTPDLFAPAAGARARPGIAPLATVAMAGGGGGAIPVTPPLCAMGGTNRPRDPALLRSYLTLEDPDLLAFLDQTRAELGARLVRYFCLAGHAD